MNEQQALHHATPLGRGVNKITGPQLLALGTCYFRNTPALGCYPAQRTAGSNSLKEFYLGSFHTNNIIFGNVEIFKKFKVNKFCKGK
jgi:hypothetical protein